jgi:hypothetical protein
MSFWSKVKDFFSGGSSSSGSNKTPKASTTTNSGDRITVSKPTGGRGSETVMSKPKNSAIDDFLMDIGAKPKNDVYYRDLADRQARSQAAMQQAMSSSDNDSGSSTTTTTTDTSTDTDTDTTTSTDTTTNLDTDTNTALTNVETISTNTFTDNADFSADVSVGAAEDDAIDLMKKGRKATILTSSKGLLSGDEEGDGRTRRRRSLIGC